MHPSPPADPAHRRTLVLAVVSFALSALWLVCWPNTYMGSDATLYEGISANLAAGHGYTYDLAEPFRPEITTRPFLAYLGGALYWLFGRHPQVLYWFNALWIAGAVALSHRLARRLFDDERAAWIGGWIVCLAPQVSGAAPSFLTEASAMFQVVAGAYLLVCWEERRNAKGLGPILWAAGTGLLLASLMLSRPNFTLAILAGSVWFGLTALRGRWSQWSGWLACVAFGAALGAPVLGWSARNASLGLGFTPVGAGAGVSYVLETERFRAGILEPRERIPASNKRYWERPKNRLGPEALVAIDQENLAWFKKLWARRHWAIIAATPRRLLHLFSNPNANAYRQAWSVQIEWLVKPLMTGYARTLWLLTAVGALALGGRPVARRLWMVTLGGMVIFHALTVCNPRYLTAVIPLLGPYAAVGLLALARLPGRWRARIRPTETGPTGAA